MTVSTVETEKTKAAVAADTKRWTYGLIAVGMGLVVILLALLVVTQKFSTATDASSVMGIVVSPIATIVAAYFGVAAGSSGKAQADDNANKANKAALTMAAQSNPDTAMETVRNLY